MSLVTNKLLRPNNTAYAPPLPQTLLVNDGKPALYPFHRGSTYRFRIINFAALGSFMVHFHGRSMTVIMTDASHTEPQKVNMLRVGPGQRYDVLITASRHEKISNVPFLIAMDINKDYRNPRSAVPIRWLHNQTGYLVMDSSGAMDRKDVVHEFDVFDESGFQPLIRNPLPQADMVFQLDFRFCMDQNNIPRACFDDNMGDPGPYVDQKVPTLYTAISTGRNNTNRSVYGHVHPMIAKHNDVVDIVVNLHDDIATHPFHLHGHQFEVLARPPPGSGPWPGEEKSNYSTNPPRRDTYQINGNSHAVIRFRADNPGVYLFHCHIEWHVEMGLMATLIEAPEMLRNIEIPEDHGDACKELGIPLGGNAGGNMVDVFDQSNYTDVSPYPYKGYV